MSSPAPDYLLLLWSYFATYALLAASLNLTVGSAGYLSLAHGGFMAVGAYAYALGTKCFGLNSLPAFLMAGLLGGACSLPISLVARRTKGQSFALASLGVQSCIHACANNWWDPRAPLGSLANLTNGPLGIADIPPPTLFAIRFATPAYIALLSTAIALVIGGALWWLRASPWGRLIRATRDDEDVCRSLGKHTHRVKAQVFAISAGVAGAAGALYTIQVGYVSPRLASLDNSILLLMMTCVGGLGTMRGSWLGAALVLVLPEVLRALPLQLSQVDTWRLLVYGVALVVLMNLRPRGLLGSEEIS